VNDVFQSTKTRQAGIIDNIWGRLDVLDAIELKHSLLLLHFSLIREGHDEKPCAPAPTLSFASIMRSTSSGRSFGSALHRSACALLSMTDSAPGRGSDRCCFIRIPRFFHISAILGIRTDGGSQEGLIQS
jgi:hypothetical protein